MVLFYLRARWGKKKTLLEHIGFEKKRLLISDFEKTLNSLTGDGNYIMADFVNLESTGPTFLFNERRDNLSGAAKHCFGKESKTIGQTVSYGC